MLRILFLCIDVIFSILAGANLQLTFAPESGNMLGGTVVNITGPCFLPGMKIRCKYVPSIT